jgi:uncharacterized protein (DUF58 family)
MSAAPARDLLRPEVLAELGNLDLIARAVVEGFLIGLHRSPWFGFSQEFAEYRAYSEGDDPRFVDWNVFARTERTYIKRYIGETNTRLEILLDASASMGYSSGPVSKLQYGKILAATLTYLASRQHDAVGLMVFDEDVREHRPASSRAGHAQSVLHAIDRAEPGTGTEFMAPFQRFHEYQKGRGLVTMISDFYFDPDQVLEAVKPLAYQGQDVLLLQVLDKQELEPELRESALMEDMETKESMEVSPSFMQARYRERIREHMDALEKSAMRAGAEYFLCDTSQPLGDVLRRYFHFRRRRA